MLHQFVESTVALVVTARSFHAIGDATLGRE
jgi:hypothetical protein